MGVAIAIFLGVIAVAMLVVPWMIVLLGRLSWLFDSWERYLKWVASFKEAD